MGSSRNARFLEAIIARKREEVRRRIAHRALVENVYGGSRQSDANKRGPRAIEALRRAGATTPRLIAEIKFRSPSAGEIRRRSHGAVEAVATAYERAGAAAVSVLADGPGFGGSPLDVRRACQAVAVPVLFKEFVLDELQVRLAHAVGASLVLLLVRVLPDDRLHSLVRTCRQVGVEPVVEAVDEPEVARALRSEATIIGVNARDLSTFEVDPDRASRAVDTIDAERIAVLMSGIKTRRDVERAASTRADALLVGEALMRAPDPGAQLRELLG